MKDTISLTVPLIHSALIRASVMLRSMADDLEGPAVDIDGPGGYQTHDLGELVTDEDPPAERNAAEVFAEKKPVDSVTEPAASTATTTSAPAPAATTTNTIELDADKMPWDHRINSLGAGGEHPQLKKTNTWKLKRNVDPALVEQVRAELKATMAAPGPAAVTTTTEPEPAAVTTTTEPDPAVDIWTFPKLMGACTMAGFDQDKILAAVQKAGLVAIPLLAARPDLIPSVALELGL